MQYLYTFVAIAAIAGLTSAQTVPSCAKPCIDSSTAKVTSCKATDIACQCIPSNNQLIAADALPCIFQNCSPTDQSATLAAAAAICAALPPAPSGATTTNAPGTTDTGVPATSVAATSGAVTSGAATSAISTSPMASHNATAATTTSPIAQHTGAAGRVAAGFGGAIGLAVAALAAL